MGTAHAARSLGRSVIYRTGALRVWAIGSQGFNDRGLRPGLRGLNDDVIGVAQFLDLNERVGGYDGDGRFSARGQGLGDPSFMKDRSESCED